MCTCIMQLVFFSSAYEHGTDSLETRPREYQATAFLSRLPGKASRTLVESRGLPSDSTCVLEVEPGRLDIKILERGILFISLQVASNYDVSVDFRVDSTSLTH